MFNCARWLEAQLMLQIWNPAKIFSTRRSKRVKMCVERGKIKYKLFGIILHDRALNGEFK